MDLLDWPIKRRNMSEKKDAILMELNVEMWKNKANTYKGNHDWSHIWSQCGMRSQIIWNLHHELFVHLRYIKGKAIKKSWKIDSKFDYFLAYRELFLIDTIVPFTVWLHILFFSFHSLLYIKQKHPKYWLKYMKAT